MDVNLFSQVDSSVEESVKNDFYGKVLEQRQRPGIPGPEEVEQAPEPKAVNVPKPELIPMNQENTLKPVPGNLLHTSMRRCWKLPPFILKATSLLQVCG